MQKFAFRPLRAALFFALLVSSGFAAAQGLTVSPAQLNFGTVLETQPDSLPLSVTNTLTRTVTVTDIRFYTTYGAPAFSTPYRWFTLAPGASNTIWVKFSPRHNIYHNSELVIENDGLRGYPHVDLVGQGRYSNAYYDSTENKSEEALKTAIKSTTTNGSISLGYNIARDSMFMLIDNQRRNGQGATQNTLESVYTGQLVVGYTDRTDAQTNYGFNTEHTFPQTYFNSLEPMKSDLHHLFPCDDISNGQRGNNPFAEVTSPTWSDGGSTSDGFRFEPRDAHKGRAARAMFFFTLRYQNYNGFLTSQENVLRNWHAAFPPDAIDRARNEAIFALQRNRNPFIDYPQFIDRITSISTLSTAPVLRSLDPMQDTIIYGSVLPAATTVYTFVVVNNGNTAVSFSNFNLTPTPVLSFAGTGADTTIGPGDALALQIACTPSTMSAVNGLLTFNTNVPGSTSFSVPIYANDPIFSAIDEADRVNLRLYPNPAGDAAWLIADNILSGPVYAYDLTGRSLGQLPTQQLGNRLQLSLAGLAPGCYLLGLHTNAGPVFTRVVKE
jgi:endonuclease I